MSAEYPLRFAAQQGSYKLLELPPDLCKLVESGAETQFTIRGRASDDAVLCTASRTYALRAVTLSNTILVATAPTPASASESSLIVRDEVSQVLELVPGAPRVQRLHGVLKGCEYDEGHERDEDEEEEQGEEDRTRKRARYTREKIRGEVQASDAELGKAMVNYRILEIDGHLRPIAPPYLTHILETLLNALISRRFPLPPERVPVRQLEGHLESELEMGGGVVRQVLGWFGEVERETWRMDEKAVVREIGLGYLTRHKDRPVEIVELEAQWRAGVGDYFAPSVELSLLKGDYLVYPAPAPSSRSAAKRVRYFPASGLPSRAEDLFAELFATRECWRGEDIEGYVGGEREKLLAMHARAMVVEGGVWYTARTRRDVKY